MGGCEIQIRQEDATEVCQDQVGSVEERLITFSHEQRDCLAGVIACALSVLTGGPGTGKTTLITALQDHYERLLVVALSAKAGLNAHEVANCRHTTIARLLGSRGDEWLDGITVLVIEEASMVGSIEMAELFKTTSHNHVRKIVLCGDPDQLAPINNGSPFIDIIKSGKAPVFRLTENHRTDPASMGIAEFCREILDGEAPHGR
jgi:exodeoxyribonuclease V alpha subunit